MRNFDEYLEQLREALGVTPKRAEEICKEVRSHLEASTRELMATGLDQGEAERLALRNVGEPRQLAVQRPQRNGKHRRGNQSWALLGFLIVFVGMFNVGVFWQAPYLSGHSSLETGAASWLTVHGRLPLRESQSLFQLLVTLPVFVLAGLLCGRRRWWMAALPPLLVALLGIAPELLLTLPVFCLVALLLGRRRWWVTAYRPLFVALLGIALLMAFRRWHASVSLGDITYMTLRGLVSVAIQGGCAYLGSRVLGRRGAGLAVGWVCGAYVTLLAWQ